MGIAKIACDFMKDAFCVFLLQVLLFLLVSMLAWSIILLLIAYHDVTKYIREVNDPAFVAIDLELNRLLNITVEYLKPIFFP